jgi:hypothetical protein
MIIVAQDVEGIRLAALQLFEESLREKEMDRVISNASQADDLTALERVVQEQKLSPGYRDWTLYLIWLKGKIDTGVNLEISADEAEGLTALVSARQEFEREHPQCFKCGARQYSKVSLRCRSCSVEFRS